MNRSDLFDVIRDIKGKGLTQAEVDRINRVLDGVSVTGVDPELVAALKKDEGCRLVAYQDTVGVWTIGYGATGAGISRGVTWTQAQAEQRLIDDIRRHNDEIHSKLLWLKSLDPVRRRVLENMAFNLGIAGLLGFKNTLEFVRTGQYAKAADGMLASKWAKQVKGRAVRLANEMRTGRAA